MATWVAMSSGKGTGKLATSLLLMDARLVVRFALARKYAWPVQLPFHARPLFMDEPSGTVVQHPSTQTVQDRKLCVYRRLAR